MNLSRLDRFCQFNLVSRQQQPQAAWAIQLAQRTTQTLTSNTNGQTKILCSLWFPSYTHTVMLSYIIFLMKIARLEVNFSTVFFRADFKYAIRTLKKVACFFSFFILIFDSLTNIHFFLTKYNWMLQSPLKGSPKMMNSELYNLSTPLLIRSNNGYTMNSRLSHKIPLSLSVPKKMIFIH